MPILGQRYLIELDSKIFLYTRRRVELQDNKWSICPSYLNLCVIGLTGKGRVHHGLHQVSALHVSNTRAAHPQIPGGHGSTAGQEEQVEELKTVQTSVHTNTHTHHVSLDKYSFICGAALNPHIVHTLVTCSSLTNPPALMSKKCIYYLYTLWPPSCEMVF